jgi:glycosyltransferase involved in cell wall biosynthesis
MVPGKEKLKVVWICHFLNQSLKEKLSIKADEQEYAPWITLGIDEFKKRDDIELHIIAPFNKILKNRYFDDGNVHYHCIKVGIPFRKREWPIRFNLDYWSNFFLFNSRVKRIVRKIKPDVINLHGAENAHYSSSILGLGDYPVLVTIQGFFNLNTVESSRNPVVRKRIEVEEKILRTMKHFGVEATSIEKHIRNYNPAAVMHWFHFPFKKTEISTIPQKEYDLVFFARVSKMKGIEDLLYALTKVKYYKPDVSMEVIGGGEETYIQYLEQLVDDLDLRSNVTFRGFIRTQQEMHLEVMKARISVLPTYNDTIPGTIIESMLLGLPVISYNTGGIPDLNRNDVNVILIEQGDKDKLSEEIIKLMKDPHRQKELGEKARKYAAKEFDNTNSANMLFKAYTEVIRDHKLDLNFK